MGTMLEKDFNYSEGKWAGHQMARNIEQTVYGSLEEAIKAKAELISKFEEDFGYSREDKEFPDRNYTYNLGILDKLKEIHESEE